MFRKYILSSLLQKIRKSTVNVQLRRVGSSNDGGYLVPDTLNEIQYCFSPGVADNASFEDELRRDYNIKCFLADGSVSEAPIQHKDLTFIQKFIGDPKKLNHISLTEWIETSLEQIEGDCLLQMDIEGAEWHIFDTEVDKTILNFSVMVVEFHGCTDMRKTKIAWRNLRIFKKILKNYRICHIHPNNCCGYEIIDGFTIPKVIEFTFIRTDVIDEIYIDDKLTLPHPLDERNLVDRDEIVLSGEWYRRENL